MSRRVSGVLWALCAGGLGTLWSCGEDATSGTRVAEGCVESDLIAQCPTGSDPMLDAASKSACEGKANLDLLERNGSVSGQCVGEGTCQVLCQFAVPCDCGVATIAREGIVCVDCNGSAACGNGTCEAMENPDTCPRDCGAVCVSGRTRCSGDALEECNLQGQWEQVACGDGQVCRRVSSDEAACQDR